MNTNLLNIVKQIITGYGEAVLADPQRLKAFFSDLAKDEPKSLRAAFGRCIEEKAYDAIRTAADSNERAERKAAIARRARDEYGLDPVLCTEALDILEAALFADRNEPPRCASCGEELQPNWKACPFCGTAAGAKQPEVPAAPGEGPARKQTPPPQAPVLPHPSAPSQQPAPNGMVFIQGGTFMMGSPESEPGRFDSEGPEHRVTVSSFYIGKYEVTQREWREVMGNNPSRFNGDNLPVEQVSWYEAVEYCNKRSERESLTPAYTIKKTIFWMKTVTWNRNANGYRLPTEAEWEYACRAGTTTPFSTGNNITTSQANYDGNYPYNGYATGGTYRGKTTPVGSFAPNAWGLYDMHGNVWEWCWDWYGDYAQAQTDPVGAGSGSYRVIRGGSWVSLARLARSAIRYYSYPSYRIDYLGFRLARNVE